MKVLKMFIAVLSVTLVAAAVALFFETENQSQKLSDAKSKTEEMFSSWEEQNNCLENPVPCENYTKQINDWLVQFEGYIERREATLEFRYYSFLKNLDESLFSGLNAGGLASLVIICIVVLIIVFLILHFVSASSKRSPFVVKTASTKSEPVRAQDIAPRLEPEPVVVAQHVVPLPESEPVTQDITPQRESEPVVEAQHVVPLPESQPVPQPLKPEDATLMLRKAAQCAESEPMQAISYLEQAIEGSLGSKLQAPALLLCGTLRLKNKIGAEEGKAQLEKIIADSPESVEAQKAKTALASFTHSAKA